MNNFFHENSQSFTTVSIPLVLILISVTVIAYINRHKIKHSYLVFKTQRCLKNLGLEQLENLRCPDGMGNHFNIDRLVLRHNGISLLSYKRYPGSIFCADHIDKWTQMIGRKSYKFENPLYELEDQISSISTIIPDIPVDGFLFFDHFTVFPKGHPARVIHPLEIPDELQQNNRHKVEPLIMAAWKKLSNLPSVDS